MMKSFARCSAILLLAFLISSPVFAADTPLALVPYPKEVKQSTGEFTITSSTRIAIARAEDRTAAEMLAEEIELATGVKPRISSGRGGKGSIYLTRTSDRDLGAIDGKDKLGEEGYVLRVTPDRVVVAGPAAAGTFYGVQTLRQLIRPDAKRAKVPALTITDWPTMRWRGVQDDVSRGPIPKMDYIKKQIRTCAEYKLNMYSLYIEHVFDFDSVPLSAPKEAGFTAAQIKELVSYASKYHITLLPQQQAFGHLHHVLKNELYADLAERPHGHVLAPVDSRSYDLVKNMYAELVQLFPGPLFHIGADETFELGRGRTEELAKSQGLGKVYLEHLKKVTEIMKPYNKRLMFWGDIAMHYPELLSILPKDVIAAAWRYSPSESFDNMLKPYHDAGLDIFVAPGANNWNVIYPNFDSAFVNIRNFVRDGQKYKAMGMLNTTWDDDGEAIFGLTWPAVVFGAAASWQQGEANIDQFTAAYDWTFYRNTDPTFRDAILNLNKAHGLLKSVGLGAANDEYFWLDPFSERGARWVEKAQPIAREMRLAAEQALVSLYKHRSKAKLHAESIDPLIMAAYRLDLLGAKIQWVTEINHFYWDAFLNQSDRARVSRNVHEITATNARLEDLRDATTRVRGMYADAWKAENHPYWLDNVLVRYDNLALQYQQKILQMKSALAQYRDTGALPVPQDLGFYLRPEQPTRAGASR